MEIKNVVVIGGGVLGSQIAYQAAYCGFDVTIWLRSEGSIGRCQPKLDHLKEVYHDTITLMDSDEGKTPQNWAMGISDYEDFDKDKCLEKAKVTSLKDEKGIFLALQSYNYGIGYINYIEQTDKQYTYQNAIDFSEKCKKDYNVSVYGDSKYVYHVLRYYEDTTLVDDWLELYR